MPMLYAFNASSEGVVAFGAGTLNFSIDPIDSPRRSRMRAAASADRGEHVGLCRCLCLISRQRVAGPAGLRFERDHIARS